MEGILSVFIILNIVDGLFLLFFIGRDDDGLTYNLPMPIINKYFLFFQLLTLLFFAYQTSVFNNIYFQTFTIVSFFATLNRFFNYRFYISELIDPQYDQRVTAFSKMFSKLDPSLDFKTFRNDKYVTKNEINWSAINYQNERIIATWFNLISSMMILTYAL